MTRLALVLLAGLMLMASVDAQPPVDRPPDQLRVLSYNIHHGEGTDGKLDLNRIASIIRQVDPDVVMLQEVDRNVRRSESGDQPTRLAQLTGMQARFGANIELQGGQYGNALLSRLPIVADQNHLLPRFDNGEQRGVLEAEVWFFGMPLRVLATHFDHRRDDRERLASAEFVNRLLQPSSTLASVLAGDINATRDTAVLQRLTEQWTIAGPDTATIPSADPQRQIDFVLHRPDDRWRVIETRVLNEPVASDHRPILVVLQWIEDKDARSDRLAVRSDVLALRQTKGRIVQAANPEQWQPRAAAIRHGMEAIMGRLPSAGRQQPPHHEVIEEVDCGTYVRRKIWYQSEPGSKTPAYLCIPKPILDGERQTAPAVLCLHPTDNRVGHDVVVGLGGKPNRQYASELAERGYVTLSPAYPLLANYQPNLEQLGWKSGTLKAVWDNIRAVDLLQSLPFVDDEAIGAIGHSLGGHNSIYTAAHDPRIRAVVSSCGLDLYQDYYGGDESKWLPEKGWTQTRYMPRLANYRGRLGDIPFDFHELIALLAPRHVMVIAPLHDSNFQVDSVRRLTAEARKVFSLHGRSERLVVLHPDCEHDFPAEMRQKAYNLFDEAFSFDNGR